MCKFGQQKLDFWWWYFIRRFTTISMSFSQISKENLSSKMSTRSSHIVPDKWSPAIPGSWKWKVIIEVFTGRINSTITCLVCFIRLLMQVLHMDNIISISQEVKQVKRFFSLGDYYGFQHQGVSHLKAVLIKHFVQREIKRKLRPLIQTLGQHLNYTESSLWFLSKIQEWVRDKVDKEKHTHCIHVRLNRSPLLWLE